MRLITFVDSQVLTTSLPLLILTLLFISPKSFLLKIQLPRLSLRHALTNVAHHVVKHSQASKDYHDLKRVKGRSHYNAFRLYAGKLLQAIYKIPDNCVEFNLH